MSADERNALRVYGEKEIGRILERATELQKTDSVDSSRSGGLSLQELEEIALEAGIEPRYLRRAALELDAGAGQTSKANWFIGNPLTLTLERTVAGELEDDEFELLVPVIQTSAGGHGHPSLLGRTLTWRFDTPNVNRSLQVVVSSRDGHTHIRIDERLHGLAGGLFGGLMGGGGGGVGLGVGLPVGLEVVGSALAAVAFPLGVIGIAYLTARGIFGAIFRSRRQALSELLERLESSVTSLTGNDVEG